MEAVLTGKRQMDKWIQLNSEARNRFISKTRRQEVSDRTQDIVRKPIIRYGTRQSNRTRQGA